MLNKELKKFSDENIKNQNDIIKQRLPFIVDIVSMDSLPADYLQGVDATAITNYGTAINIQYKSRTDKYSDLSFRCSAVGNDAPNAHYVAEYNQHFILNLQAADLFVQTAKGITYLHWRHQIEQIACGNAFWENVQIFSVPSSTVTNECVAYISPEKLNELISVASTFTIDGSSEKNIKNTVH